MPCDWSPEALDAYLALQYVPCPQTIYRSIWKLPPAHYLVAENGRVSIRRYWDLAFTGDAAQRLPGCEYAAADVLGLVQAWDHNGDQRPGGGLDRGGRVRLAGHRGA